MAEPPSLKSATSKCAPLSSIDRGGSVDVPEDSLILDELGRVLAPGGRLVLGTPDYANWQWVWVEKAYAIAAPGGYADEHIAHYTRRELVGLFESRGYTCEATRYVLKGELILAFRKPPLASAGRSAHPVAAR